MSRTVHIYNNSIIDINRSNSLTICDWDDTLFPTSWVNLQNIDLLDPRYRYSNARYFDVLDKNLFNLIKRIIKKSDLLIVTNATLQWIDISLSVLPQTQSILKSVPIVSAREQFSTKCDMQDWKKYTFRSEILKSQKNYKNIISIGDANYEHEALVALFKWDVIPHKYLKSIKFFRSTNKGEHLEQIKLIKKHIDQIIDATRHLDMVLK